MPLDVFLSFLRSCIPTLILGVITILILWVTHKLLLGRHAAMGMERRIPRQLTLLGLTLVGIIVVVLSLPISDSSRNQIIALIGLLVSGVFAFSSTTVVANIMAGAMLRVTKPFSAGDYIRVDSFFGRVTERGLLDTGVQTEQRELISIPNTFLIQRPVSVINADGAVISVSLSLGYDVHHDNVQELLLKAAKSCDLKDAFVLITELGNFSVTYKVNGLLADVKSLITKRTQLCGAVLDTLHEAGVEILSPTVMNQRPIPTDVSVIPEAIKKSLSPVQSNAEDVVFDKAELAEKREAQRKKLLKKIKNLEVSIKESDEEECDRLKDELKETKEQLLLLEKRKSGNHNDDFDEEDFDEEVIEEKEADDSLLPKEKE